jgi:GcrA cell cycle regulator
MSEPGGWTEERVELLKTLWHKGLSASQIAYELRYVSRNAVIGKTSRLGLKRDGASLPNQKGRARSVTQQLAKLSRPTKPRATPKPPKVASPAILPAPYVLREIPLTPTCTLVALGARMCRWPIGDPSDDAFGFCGRIAEGGRSYCFAHVAVASRGSVSASELIRGLRRFA